MLDDLIDELNESKKPKKRKFKSTKKGSPSKRKKAEPKPVENVSVDGDMTDVPESIHKYLLTKYSFIYYRLGDEQDKHTRQFHMWDDEIETENYMVKMNITGGGNTAIVKSIEINED